MKSVRMIILTIALATCFLINGLSKADDITIAKGQQDSEDIITNIINFIDSQVGDDSLDNLLDSLENQLNELELAESGAPVETTARECKKLKRKRTISVIRAVTLTLRAIKCERDQEPEPRRPSP